MSLGDSIANMFSGQEESPTSSPIEFSNRTIYNDGATHIIDSKETSFSHETIIVTDYTTLIMKGDESYIIAPDKSDWPAIRLSIGGVFNGTRGLVQGSSAVEMDGGDAIEMYNGQSTPESASFGYFYEGISVIGGHSSTGVGGNALHVHGSHALGTEAFIYGGRFEGGKGSNGDDGLSINVLNSAKVNIHSGTFIGDMVVGDSSIIALYGCFSKNNNIISGTFVDETSLEVKVRENGGRVELISVAAQECDTAPSTAPTNFPTISPQPTIPRNGGTKMESGTIGLILAAFACLYNLLCLE